MHIGIKKGTSSSSVPEAEADSTAVSAGMTKVVPYTDTKDQTEGRERKDSDDLTFGEKREKIEQEQRYAEETKESHAYVEDLDQSDGNQDEDDGPDASGQWMI